MKAYRPLETKNIALGVSGGIAAYRALDLANGLRKKGARVHTIMTRSAAKLVGPASFEAITQNPVILDDTAPERFRMDHIDLADLCDGLIVAPATANIIGKAACGIADDRLSTTILTMYDRLLFAPAMNTRMWCSPALQDNIQKLFQRGAVIIPPIKGRLACGDVGYGHLAQLDDILLAAENFILKRETPLRRARIIITAGATVAPLDPVRFLSNRSSGKMGVHLARAAQKFSKDVLLIHGRLRERVPAGITSAAVETNEQMLIKIRENSGADTILIMAAAPVDFRFADPSERKRAKGELADITLTPDLDILDELRDEPFYKVGFALETENGKAKAAKKLERKKLDLIVLNEYVPGISGFDSATNRAVVFGDHFQTELPLATKEEIAARLLEIIASRYRPPSVEPVD